MVDPISIGELSLACLGIAVKLGQLINQLRHAPDELLALSNETCDLRNVLETVRKTLATPHQYEVVGVAPQLFLANIRFEELDRIVSRLGQMGSWSDNWNIGVWERLLWKKEKSKIVKLQQQLREIRTNISLALEANSMSACFKIGVDLQDFVRQTSTFQKGHGEALRGHKTGMDEIMERQRETNYLLEALVQAMPQLSTESKVPGSSSPGQATLVEPDEDVGEVNRSGHGRNDSSSSYDSAESGSSELTVTKSNALDEEKANGVIAIPVTSSNFNPNACWSDCACDCHKRQTYRTPQFLADLAGRLSIGYNGSMFLRRQCNLSTCHMRSAAAPQMMYFFPTWFLKQAISLSMISNTMTPHLSLKIRRVVPEMSQLFRLARYGDVSGVQQLFSGQQASPDDVHVLGGWTALHFAVDHGSVELCRLLLEQGADANWEDGIGSTPVEYARRNILMPRVCARAAEVYSVVIAKASHLQERYFSQLHELILDLKEGDVEEEILAHPSTMHARDIYGWTPLHWASRRGDVTNTALLLKHGADPFMKTLDDQCNPVHLAARGNSPGVIRICLAHTYKGRRLDIDDWDHRARTALRIGSSNNCVAAAALLIELGSEVDNADRQNETSLLSCVYENAHDSIPVIIKAGASPKAFTKSGNSILHFAANESDLTTLALLTNAQLEDVDIGMISMDGFTARELAASRIGAPPGFLEAFDRLIASIEEATARAEVPSLEPTEEKAMEAGLSPKRARFADDEKLGSSDSRPSSGDSKASNESNEAFQEPPSRASTIMSDAESFKSFEEMIWHEAEMRGLRDIEEADWESGDDEQGGERDERRTRTFHEQPLRRNISEDDDENDDDVTTINASSIDHLSVEERLAVRGFDKPAQADLERITSGPFAPVRRVNTT
ncbi:MAG: hypothetical protein M1828_004154 [Chrysothrix sp. TS-e1954]|nr:MAG: hypothetical protein M1828_004154 [Chrysothrix sp. TS-e1954]